MNRISRPFVFIAVLLASLCAATAASAAYYDPPGRVARLSHSQGEVSYSPAGEDGWYRIHRNRPLGRGDRLWTDRGSRAEFQVGSAAVRLDARTGVEILELNDRLVQLEVSQGSVYLSVRRLYAGQEFEVATPNLAFVIDRPGTYRIDVEPRYDSTTVVVWRGSGTAYGDNGRFSVRAGEAVSFYDNDMRDYEVYGLPRSDDFDRYSANRDRRLGRSVSLRYLSDDLIGYSDLDAYGYWQPTPSYGNVWFPNQVGAGWAPYSDGQWIWLEPWGWTWVDNADWGFAPSHYGRWVYLSGRWGWIPGPRSYRPVYAPALVVFVGGSGWNLTISLGGDMSIGWFPLGPREVYVPPYQTSANYFSQVNISNTVINNVTINQVYNNYSRGDINITRINYVNRTRPEAITAVPAKVFVNSQPVRPARVRLDRDALAKGELSRLAPITPRARSVLGVGDAATARPERAVLARPVVVRTAPPPAVRPFADRERLLQQKPGRPLEARPEPRPRDEAQRNIRVIRDRTGAADARRAGPRRTDESAPAATGTPKPLDRTAPRQRRPVREGEPSPAEETRDEPRAAAAPASTVEQRQAARAEAQAKARADAAKARDEAAEANEDAAKAREEAARAREAAAKARVDEQANARAAAQKAREAEQQARADEQQARAQAQASQRAEEQAQARAAAQAQARAREDEQAQARARAQQEQARAETQARADAQARAEAQAQARAQAQEQARADARAEAQARQREEARAAAQARGQAGTPETAQQQSAQASREARRAARTAPRRPPGCLTVAEVQALKRNTARGQPLPEYVPCEDQ